MNQFVQAAEKSQMNLILTQQTIYSKTIIWTQWNISKISKFRFGQKENNDNNENTEATAEFQSEGRRDVTGVILLIAQILLYQVNIVLNKGIYFL